MPWFLPGALFLPGGLASLTRATVSDRMATAASVRMERLMVFSSGGISLVVGFRTRRYFACPLHKHHRRPSASGTKFSLLVPTLRVGTGGVGRSASRPLCTRAQ